MRNLIIACLMLSTTPAWACSPVPPQPGVTSPTMQDLFNTAPVVFVGRVTSVAEGNATLTVERAIRGVEGKEITVSSGGSTCMVSFIVGTRWLYLGSDIRSGTLPLIHQTIAQAQALIPGIE